MNTLRKTISTLTAAAVLSGAIVVAAPTPSASAAPVSCRQSHAVYSPDEYQWAIFDVCTRVEGNQLFVSVVAKEIQYYWGGTWYSNSYDVSLAGNVVLTRDGATAAARQYSATGSGTDLSSDLTFSLAAPGDYEVVVSGALTGSYWYSTSSSDVISDTFSQRIPVAF